MGIKRYCDRCGTIINPPTSCTPITVWASGNVKQDYGTQDYDLCVSCAFKLKKFLEAESEE